MTTRKVLVIVVLAVILLVHLSGLSAQSVDKASDDESSYRIRITWDPATLPLDHKQIADLLRNPTRIAQGLPEDIRSLATQGASFRPFLYSEKGSARAGVLLGDYRPAVGTRLSAEKVLEAVLGQLQALLEEEYRVFTSVSENRVRLKLEQARWHQDRLALELNRVRSSIMDFWETAARPDLPWRVEKNRALITEFDYQAKQLEIKKRAKSVRLHAIGEQIAEIVQAATVDQTKNDAITQGLTQILELKKKTLKNLNTLVVTGRASEAELIQAETELLQSQLELDRRKNELLRAAGNLELLAKLKAEQTSLIIDLREIGERQRAAKKGLHDAQVVGEDLEGELRRWELFQMEMEDRKMKLAQMRRQYERASHQAYELEQEIGASYSVRPTVTIIEPKEEKTSTEK